MVEVDLLKNYPKPKRKVSARAAKKTIEVQQVARKFGREYFDGDRLYGYGGFFYNPRFWEPVIPDFVKHYSLTKRSKVLDVGCAKGFMLFDFTRLVPGIKISGIDISRYAIKNALSQVKPFIKYGNAIKLPFPNKSFDLVISINTIHNLPLKNLIKALLEIERVGKHAFITVDAYRDVKEKKRMEQWNLTAQTIMHVDDWKKLFKKVGYTGDYFWFIP